MVRKIIIAAASALFVASIGFQIWQVYRFVNAGPRFTAQDGQALCERVKALEEHSYGFANAGLKPLDCNYGTRP